MTDRAPTHAARIIRVVAARLEQAAADGGADPDLLRELTRNLDDARAAMAHGAVRHARARSALVSWQRDRPHDSRIAGAVGALDDAAPWLSDHYDDDEDDL